MYTVATDGDLNKFQDLDMLGYNKKVMDDVIDFADNSITTYSQSVMLSVAGADSYLSRQKDPSPDSPIPAVTLYEQKWLDNLSTTVIHFKNLLEGYRPLLMDYIIQ